MILQSVFPGCGTSGLLRVTHKWVWSNWHCACAQSALHTSSNVSNCFRKLKSVGYEPMLPMLFSRWFLLWMHDASIGLFAMRTHHTDHCHSCASLGRWLLRESVYFLPRCRSVIRTEYFLLHQIPFHHNLQLFRPVLGRRRHYRLCLADWQRDNPGCPVLCSLGVPLAHLRHRGPHCLHLCHCQWEAGEGCGLPGLDGEFGSCCLNWLSWALVLFIVCVLSGRN